MFEIVWRLTYEVLTLTQAYLIQTNLVFHSFSHNGFTKLSIDISFLDICVLFEALIYSDKLCSGQRNVSLCRTLFCLLHFLTVCFLKSRTFAFYAFFSKSIFLKSQLKVENSFLKLCKKYTFKVKTAIYRLIKIKIKNI